MSKAGRSARAIISTRTWRQSGSTNDQIEEGLHRIRRRMAADGFVQRLEIFPNGKQDVDAVLNVRIHLPPAESPCLAGFCPLTSKAGLFPPVCGWSGQRGRERRAWRGETAPTVGNVSVRPYSSTAVPARG